MWQNKWTRFIWVNYLISDAPQISVIIISTNITRFGGLKQVPELIPLFYYLGRSQSKNLNSKR